MYISANATACPTKNRKRGFAPRAQLQHCSNVHRVFTALVLFFFGFQFSRFYFNVSLDRHTCPGPAASEVLEMHQGHNHPAMEMTSPLPAEGGPYFQHCKEFLDGMGLTPVQPMTETIEITFPWTPPVPVVAFPQNRMLPQNDLAPPFHPPRALA
jgi:hypothetical protein